MPAAPHHGFYGDRVTFERPGPVNPCCECRARNVRLEEADQQDDDHVQVRVEVTTLSSRR